MASLLRSVVDGAAKRIADEPIRGYGPIVDDLIIPKATTQPNEATRGVRVNFGRLVSHQLLLLSRITLPDWLKVHRAGHEAVIGVYVAGDFGFPLSWCWPDAPPDTLSDIHPVRLVMVTLTDGTAVARVERDTGPWTHVDLPLSAGAPWLAAMHAASITYLSHKPSDSIMGEADRFGRLGP
jgi:hypothetical protein